MTHTDKIAAAAGLFLLLLAAVGFLLHWYVIDVRLWFRRANDLPGPDTDGAGEFQAWSPPIHDTQNPEFWTDENYAKLAGPDAWDAWNQRDPEDAADQLIAEWHTPDPDGLTAEDWIARDLADLELLAWDARVQAARCWEIVHVEFPRLRAELCVA